MSRFLEAMMFMFWSAGVVFLLVSIAYLLGGNPTGTAFMGVSIGCSAYSVAVLAVLKADR